MEFLVRRRSTKGYFDDDEPTSSKFPQPDSSESNPEYSLPKSKNTCRTTNAEITEQECEPGAADFLHQDKDKKGPFGTPDTGEATNQPPLISSSSLPPTCRIRTSLPLTQLVTSQSSSSFQAKRQYHVLGNLFLPDPSQSGLDPDHQNLAYSARPLLAELHSRDMQSK